MKGLVALMLASGLLIGGCREQRTTERAPERERTALTSEATAVRSANSFQYSMQAVLADADRQIDQLAHRIRGPWNAPAELERRLQDVRRRHTSLRREVRLMGRRIPDRASRADVRRQLSGLQHALEVAQLKAIRMRHEFESEIQSHVEGAEAQIELLGRQVRVASCPGRAADRWKVARVKNRHERLEQKLPVLQAASRDEFDAVRRQVTREVVGLRADVRRLANEMDCIAGTGRSTIRHGG